MKNSIDIRIESRDDDRIVTDKMLQELRIEIRKELDVVTKLESSHTQKHSMGVDAVTAVAILGLSLNALNVFFGILRFFLEKKRYSEKIIITGENYERVIEGLTRQEAEAIIKDIEKKELSDLVVKIKSTDFG